MRAASQEPWPAARQNGPSDFNGKEHTDRDHAGASAACNRAAEDRRIRHAYLRYPGYSSPDGTISTPSGIRLIGISLKFASPNGMPMMVRHNAMPATRWPRASSQPSRTIQMMLPI